MAGVIVQEWLAEHGGSENVSEEVAGLFPDAKIVCLWNDNPDRFPPQRVSESWIANTPLRKSKGLALPFMPPTWRHLGDSDADWIFCSSHLFAHHARFSGTARDAPKFVYAHTPARYIWNPELDQRGDSFVVRAAAVGLKPLDRHRAQEATAIAANSEFVRRRIKDAWGRDSTVIFPPVDVESFERGAASALNEGERAKLDGLPGEFILGASRLIPYKRLDLVIRSGELLGVPVVIAGAGPLEGELRALAAESQAEVVFYGRPSDSELAALFSRARAFVFPAIEDFGIMPIEAMAAGTPVISIDTGGAAESILHGKTGALVHEFSKRELLEAEEIIATIDGERCRQRAREFDRAEFDHRIREWMAIG